MLTSGAVDYCGLWNFLVPPLLLGEQSVDSDIHPRGKALQGDTALLWMKNHPMLGVLVFFYYLDAALAWFRNETAAQWLPRFSYKLKSDGFFAENGIRDCKEVILQSL